HVELALALDAVEGSGAANQRHRAVAAVGGCVRFTASEQLVAFLRGKRLHTVAFSTAVVEEDDLVMRPFEHAIERSAAAVVKDQAVHFSKHPRFQRMPVHRLDLGEFTHFEDRVALALAFFPFSPPGGQSHEHRGNQAQEQSCGRISFEHDSVLRALWWEGRRNGGHVDTVKTVRAVPRTVGRCFLPEIYRSAHAAYRYP